MFDVFYIGKTSPTISGINMIPVMSELEAMQRCNTRYCWLLYYLCDYSTFDFLWEPVPWEREYKHVWGSKWQMNSRTILLPRNGYTDVKYHDELEITMATHHPVIVLDHGNIETDNVISQIESKGLQIKKKARFINNYRDTLKRILALANDEFVWVCSSICDYSSFDFSWHPSEWQNDMLHVFPSNNEKFGDTFLINVSSFNKRINTTELLEWYDTLHFVSSCMVPRFPIMHIEYDNNDDNLVEVIKAQSMTLPYVILHPADVATDIIDITPVMWREQTRKIHSFTESNNTIAVPRDAIQYIKSQCYDYPHISKKSQYLQDPLQDVIFISNGEDIAEQNWEILKSICPRAKRSEGITGREKAYKAAAKLSNTPWFYAVFAKTEVLPSFDFTFQPDYLQVPKHYIFYSRNPINGLEYGAMNINLYNKKHVLNTKPKLDFTLSAPHETVPIVASISRFNTDPRITWRSAFREVMKLKREVDLGADVEIEYRLNKWCVEGVGENADYCLQGANDSLEYYEEVNGELDALELSFDWQWCQDYYYKKYKTKIW